MIKRVFVGANNQAVSIVDGESVEVQLNTPLNSVFYDLSFLTQVSIGDYFENGQLINLGDKPSKYTEFDYSTKQWIDPRTIEQLKAQKWIEIKIERDSLEFGGFVFEGGIYDSNQLSQGRIMNAVNADLPQIWTLADNTTRLLSFEQLKSLNQALQKHIASIHERGRIARNKIVNATSKDALAQITL